MYHEPRRELVSCHCMHYHAIHILPCALLIARKHAVPCAHMHTHSCMHAHTLVCMLVKQNQCTLCAHLSLQPSHCWVKTSIEQYGEQGPYAVLGNTCTQPIFILCNLLSLFCYLYVLCNTLAKYNYQSYHTNRVDYVRGKEGWEGGWYQLQKEIG